LFNGKTVADGATVEAFKESSAPVGSKCESEVRKCSDGVISGTFPASACVVETPLNCTFNGAAVANGKTVKAFEKATVPFGSTCNSEVRSCANGKLGGTFTASACAVTPLHFADLTSGTWTIACQAGNNYQSYKSRFIDGPTPSLEVLWHNWDTTCTKLQSYEYQRLKMSQIVEKPDATGTTFTWRYDRQEDGLKPMTQAIADMFNMNRQCGKTGYVTGKLLQNLAPGVMCGPAVQYWTSRLERRGTVQSIYVGDVATGDGKTPATRATALDRRAAYTRVLDLKSTVANPKTVGSLRP
jgi:hypothetical protein